MLPWYMCTVGTNGTVYVYYLYVTQHASMVHVGTKPTYSLADVVVAIPTVDLAVEAAV